LTSRELDLFRQGDHGVFRRIVDIYSPRLMAITTCYASDPDDARDLLQETWFRAYDRRNQFASRGTLIGWLYALCRTVCLDAQVRRKTRERHASGAASGFEGKDPGRHWALRRSLHEAFAALPPREQEVAVMRLVEGYSTRETAQRLGCAEGTVKAALCHAVQKLRTSMEGWIS
jgi:RNA polymerase sigma-70 factor (ECF subfamily)